MQQQDKHSTDNVLISSERILTRLLEKIWTVMLFVVVLAGTSSVLRTLVTGWHPVYGLQLALVALYACCYLLRAKLSFAVRAAILVGLFYLVGVSALYYFGILGAGVWWLVLCCLIASVFYGSRVAIAHAVLCLLLILGAAAGYISSRLTLPFDAVEYVRSPATWASLIIGCALLSVFIFAAVASYQRATLALLREVAENKRQIEQNLEEIRTLRGFIPICAQCKQIRDDRGYWASVEDYLQKHADLKFSHCMCPDCGRKLYGEAWEQATQQVKKGSV
jgi:hypothetical protein